MTKFELHNVLCWNATESFDKGKRVNQGIDDKGMMDDGSSCNSIDFGSPARRSSKRKKQSNEIESHEYTPLFKAIEDKKWNVVMQFLETGEIAHFSLCQCLGSSQIVPNATEQARTWVVYKDWCGKMIWKKLPIHEAVIQGAPIDVIQKLFQSYPEGVRCVDDKGNLPLHLSFQHGDQDEVTAFLLRVYPESVSTRNHKGHYPVDYAPEGCREIIQLCVHQTNFKAKKEEARLHQALECEKSRLTEILSQLSSVRNELEGLRKSKSKPNQKSSTNKKSMKSSSSSSKVRIVNTGSDFETEHDPPRERGRFPGGK